MFARPRATGRRWPGRASRTTAATSGSGACRACHPSEHASWSRTYHRTMTQRGEGRRRHHDRLAPHARLLDRGRARRPSHAPVRLFVRRKEDDPAERSVPRAAERAAARRAMELELHRVPRDVGATAPRPRDGRQTRARPSSASRARRATDPARAHVAREHDPITRWRAPRERHREPREAPARSRERGVRAVSRIRVPARRRGVLRERLRRSVPSRRRARALAHPPHARRARQGREARHRHEEPLLARRHRARRRPRVQRDGVVGLLAARRGRAEAHVHVVPLDARERPQRPAARRQKRAGCMHFVPQNAFESLAPREARVRRVPHAEDELRASLRDPFASRRVADDIRARSRTRAICVTWTRPCRGRRER